MFRHERPQAGRLRQFYQIGVEQIGGTSLQNKDEGFLLQQDFTSINTAWLCLQSIFSLTDTRPKLKLEINSLGAPGTLQAFNKELIKVLHPHHDKLSKVS